MQSWEIIIVPCQRSCCSDEKCFFNPFFLCCGVEFFMIADFFFWCKARFNIMLLFVDKILMWRFVWDESDKKVSTWRRWGDKINSYPVKLQNTAKSCVNVCIKQKNPKILLLIRVFSPKLKIYHLCLNSWVRFIFSNVRVPKIGHTNELVPLTVEGLGVNSS